MHSPHHGQRQHNASYVRYGRYLLLYLDIRLPIFFDHHGIHRRWVIIPHPLPKKSVRRSGHDPEGIRPIVRFHRHGTRDVRPGGGVRHGTEPPRSLRRGTLTQGGGVRQIRRGILPRVGRGEAGGPAEKAHAGGGGRRIRRGRREDPGGILRRVGVIAAFDTKIEDRIRRAREAGGGKCTIKIEVLRNRSNRRSTQTRGT